MLIHFVEVIFDGQIIPGGGALSHKDHTETIRNDIKYNHVLYIVTSLGNRFYKSTL